MNEKLKDAQELYELVLEGASHFLRNAKAFEIHILRGHNPSYEEIAEIMGSLASLICDLADDFDPMLAQKASDYVYLMRKMAIAITNAERVKLLKLVKELDAKPFL